MTATQQQTLLSWLLPLPRARVRAAFDFSAGLDATPQGERECGAHLEKGTEVGRGGGCVSWGTAAGWGCESEGEQTQGVLLTAPGLLRAILEGAKGAVQPWRWGGEQGGKKL